MKIKPSWKGVTIFFYFLQKKIICNHRFTQLSVNIFVGVIVKFQQSSELIKTSSQLYHVSVKLQVKKPYAIQVNFVFYMRISTKIGYFQPNRNKDLTKDCSLSKCYRSDCMIILDQFSLSCCPEFFPNLHLHCVLGFKLAQTAQLVASAYTLMWHCTVKLSINTN